MILSYRTDNSIIGSFLSRNINRMDCEHILKIIDTIEEHGTELDYIIVSHFFNEDVRKAINEGTLISFINNFTIIRDIDIELVSARISSITGQTYSETELKMILELVVDDYFDFIAEVDFGGKIYYIFDNRIG